MQCRICPDNVQVYIWAELVNFSTLTKHKFHLNGISNWISLTHKEHTASIAKTSLLIKYKMTNSTELIFLRSHK
jgi:hypothetical protein